MATITELTTLALVKAQLGITDSSQDTEIQAIVDATNLRIYKYCNRNFTNQTYVHQEKGTNDNIVILPNAPINNIFYKGKGAQGAITVKYTGTAVGSVEVVIDNFEQIFTLKLIESTAVAETVTLSTAKNLGDIATEINAFGNWEATVETNYDIYPALAILSTSYPSLEQDQQLTIDASICTFELRSVQRANGLYDANRIISQGSDYVIIYDGGYATIPADLSGAATQIAVNVYNLTKHDMNLQGEKIGDYSWIYAEKWYIWY